MTTSDLLTDLATRGIQFFAAGDKLRLRPADRLTPDDLASLQQHKPAILRLLRAEGRTWPIIPGREHFSLYVANEHGDWPEFVPGHHVDARQTGRPPAADTCTRCGSTEFVDVPIHAGRSLRRDCAQCGLFAAWPRWQP